VPVETSELEEQTLKKSGLGGILIDGLPIAGCGADVGGGCGRVVGVVEGRTGVVGGVGGRSVVGGEATRWGGSVDDGTVVDGTAVVGADVLTGCELPS
jgi:hypothetical protein